MVSDVPELDEPVLQASEIMLLRGVIGRLTALAEGRRLPTTPAQEQFQRVARGECDPVAPYEIAFMKWRAALVEEPAVTLAELEERLRQRGVMAAAAGSASLKPKKRKKRPPKKKTGMTVAQAKASRPSRWTAEDVERTHKLSGFSRMRARLVPGGKVSPR